MIPTVSERDTHQRRAIRNAFREAGRPLSPVEVLAAASVDVPNLGTATIYRTVKSLLEAGWLIPVALPGEPPRYELAGKDHHHHFHCRACGKLFELEGCPEGLRQLTPAGFQMEAHEVVLYGQCAECA